VTVAATASLREVTDLLLSGADGVRVTGADGTALGGADFGSVRRAVAAARQTEAVCTQ
jgi:hypothetical protein